MQHPLEIFCKDNAVAQCDNSTIGTERKRKRPLRPPAARTFLTDINLVRSIRLESGKPAGIYRIRNGQATARPDGETGRAILQLHRRALIVGIPRDMRRRVFRPQQTRARRCGSEVR